MRDGAALINASRGSVIEIDALVELGIRQSAGRGVNVFPTEPKSNADPFESPLKKFDNVILTPHVGGSTEEAQESIGVEVAEKIVRFQKNGSTLSAVNFPEVSLPRTMGPTGSYISIVTSLVYSRRSTKCFPVAVSISPVSTCKPTIIWVMWWLTLISPTSSTVPSWNS